jgi:hypothetical protein
MIAPDARLPLVSTQSLRLHLCFSAHLYHARNLVERLFNRIKQCRRIATRYDKLAANYLASFSWHRSGCGFVLMSPRLVSAGQMVEPWATPFLSRLALKRERTGTHAGGLVAANAGTRAAKLSSQETSRG